MKRFLIRNSEAVAFLAWFPLGFVAALIAKAVHPALLIGMGPYYLLGTVCLLVIVPYLVWAERARGREHYHRCPDCGHYRNCWSAACKHVVRMFCPDCDSGT